jgi:hypothetical protein
VRAAVAVVFLVLVLAACGGGSSGEAGKSAKQIVQDAVKNAQAARSVHMAGSIPGPLVVDLRVAKPSNATGTVSLQGTNVKLVRIGDTVYVNGDSAFWTRFLGNAAAKRYAGHWFKTSASQSNFAGIARLTDINQFFNGATASRGTLGKKGTTTYNGQKVIAIVDNGKNGATFYVTASGTPYPVAIVGGTGSKAGAIRFSDWNQPVSVTAPKGAKPLPIG